MLSGRSEAPTKIATRRVPFRGPVGCGGSQAQGAQNLILDLRQNPGGLVRGSVDIARLFLDSSRDNPAPIFTVAGTEASARV